MDTPGKKKKNKWLTARDAAVFKIGSMIGVAKAFFAIKIWGWAVIKFPTVTGLIVTALVKCKMAIAAAFIAIGEWT